MLLNSCRLCGADTGATNVSEHLATEHSALLAHALLTPTVSDPNIAWIRQCLTEIHGFGFLCNTPDFTDSSHASFDDDSSSTASDLEAKPAAKSGRKAVYKDAVFLVNNQKYVRCLVCDHQLHWTQRRVHIYTAHLGVPDLFHCPHCPYASKSSRYPVDNHVRKRHNAKGSAVVRLGEFEAQIISWLGKCFRLDSAAVAPPARARMRRSPSPQVASSSRPQAPRSSTTASPRTVKAKMAPKVSGTRVTCEICKAKVMASGTARHVLQDHLKLPHLYKCPQCDFGSSTYDAVVTEHAKFKHNLDHIISYADKYAPQINAMTAVCFPYAS